MCALQANAVSDKILDLRQCNFTGKNLSGKVLSGALLKEATLPNSILRETVLTKVCASPSVPTVMEPPCRYYKDCLTECAASLCC